MINVHFPKFSSHTDSDPYPYSFRDISAIISESISHIVFMREEAVVMRVYIIVHPSAVVNQVSSYFDAPVRQN